MILPRPELHSVWTEWATRLVQALSQTEVAPVPLAAYVKAKMPSAAKAKYHMILVTDEAGGAVPAFSDGVNWRRVTDRAVVS